MLVRKRTHDERIELWSTWIVFKPTENLFRSSLCTFSLVEIVFCEDTSFKKQPPKVFCQKGVLRNFKKFTGKHLCQSLFFSKVVSLRPATLLKKRLWHRCFPVNFLKFLREHLWWLFLSFYMNSNYRQDNQKL